MNDAIASGSVGVLLPRDLPAARVPEFVRGAEELGFDELWVVEDLRYRGGIAQAAAALAITSRITVGIGILPVGARNAAFAAMEVATIAELFPGRLVAGVGHGMPGWMRSLDAWPDSPLTLLEEYVTMLRALLRGERVDVDGRYVKAADMSLAHPVADVPPVLVGVRGPRSLALAGRVADGTVLAEPAAPEYIRTAVEQIAATRPHRVVTYDVAAVDDDPALARAAARAALTWLGEPDSAPHVRPLPFADELTALRARSADPHAFAAALPDAWVDRLAVVGTPPDVRAAVAVRHEAGATTVVLIPVGADPTAALGSLAQAL